MKVRRLYRTWAKPDCHIMVKKFNTKRIMTVFNPHFHSELEIIYITSGRYEIYRPEGNFMAEAGTVCIAMPNEIHSIRALRDEGEYLCLIIDPSAISMGRDHFFQKGFVEPLLTGRLRMPAKLAPTEAACTQLVKKLEAIRILAPDDPAYYSCLFVSTMSICIELMDICCVTLAGNQEKPFGSAVVNSCVAYMQANYVENISLAALAEHVHVHPNYLCEVFKRTVGMTVLEYLNRIRVDRAIELIREEYLSVGQMAERCGFQSVSTFQRTFKTYTGTTPSSYAKIYSRQAVEK